MKRRLLKKRLRRAWRDERKGWRRIWGSHLRHSIIFAMKELERHGAAFAGFLAAHQPSTVQRVTDADMDHFEIGETWTPEDDGYPNGPIDCGTLTVVSIGGPPALTVDQPEDP